MRPPERAGGPLRSILRVTLALWVSFLAVFLLRSAVESATGIRLHPVVTPVGTVLLATALLTALSKR